MINKNVILPIATGVEELEFVTIVDVLRRAGVAVRVSSLEERLVTGAHGIKFTADSDFIDEVLEDYDALVLPGGSGAAERYRAHLGLQDAIRKFAKTNIVAAICASPGIALAPTGILDSKKATGYPALKEHIKNYVDQPVVVDGNIITSQGPGTALSFAFTLAEILAGKDMAQKVRRDMLINA